MVSGQFYPISGGIVPKCFTYSVTITITIRAIMNQIKVVPVLKMDKADRFGTIPIWFRITQNRKSTYHTTGYKCKLEEWDDDKKRVLKSVEHHVLINSDIRKQIGKLEKEIIEHDILDKNLTISMVKDISLNKTSKADFYATATIMINTEENVTVATVVNYHKNVRALKMFREKVNFNDLTVDFIKKYEVFCTKRKNSHNTIVSKMTFISKVISYAVSNQQYNRNDNPFLKIKFNFVNTERMWLTQKEVTAIHTFLESGYPEEKIINSGWYFLFSCYCGLRFSDVGVFDEATHVINGMLTLYVTKTGTRVSIPIHKRLKEVIDKLSTLPPMMSCKWVNLHLKTIAAKSNINKHIHFHSSRHTFAIECARLGISIETVKKLLGHKKVETTEIYYKILDSRVNKEMLAWDEATH